MYLATNGNTHLIYSLTNGALFYSADGTSAHTHQLAAILGNPSISFEDFQVYTASPAISNSILPATHASETVPVTSPVVAATSFIAPVDSSAHIVSIVVAPDFPILSQLH